jgi:hypothetical protein
MFAGVVPRLFFEEKASKYTFKIPYLDMVFLPDGMV